VSTVVQLLLSTSDSWAIAIVRVALGVIFIGHGAQKVFGWFGGYGLKATAASFAGLGIPVAVAYAVCIGELLGGIGLVFGLLTRPSGLAVIATMAGAIVKVHGRYGLFLNWAQTPGKGHGYEANLAYLAMALACLLAGGGALSVDYFLAR
jgi:putative oxidoreductase